MFRKKYLSLICSLFFLFNSLAQSNNLPVNISMDKNPAGDSLWLNISINSYTKPSSLMFRASLENTAVEDTFYIPVIDSAAQYCFIFPDSIHDNLSLEAYFFPGIFKVSGIMNTGKKPRPVKAILITDNDKIYNKEISFLPGNRFSLPALVFEKEASLVFNYIDDNKWKSHPDISISVSPTAADFKELLFKARIDRLDTNTGEQASIIYSNDSLKKIIKDTKFKTLKEVEVTGTRKSDIQKFNEEYSTGLFNDPSEKVIDCLNNNDILSYPNCISYLQGQVAGLNISYDENGEMVAKWRGKETKAFFIDEIPVDLEQVLSINTAEIAMLKVYPPAFFGSSKGDGGGIALYTRRGGYSRPDAPHTQWLFTVKGYAPSFNVLFDKE